MTIADADQIDYQDNTSHDVSVTVTDKVGHTITKTLTIEVAPSSRAPESLKLVRDESDEFALNENTTGDQLEPVVTALESGGFLTVWTNRNATASTGGDGSSYSIKAQRFDADGQPVGNEFRVNQSTSSTQQHPSVTTLTNGDVLVTWITAHSSGYYRTYGRRYDEDGNALTGEFTLFQSSGSHQYEPEVTALEGGGYLATWHDSTLDGSNNGVYAQRFDADNNGLGQFRVNTYTASHQDLPDATGLPDGGYVIVWDGRGADQTSDDGVYLRHYSADGETLLETTVSNTVASTQYRAQVTTLADGNYVVSWSSYHDGYYDVYARVFNDQGQAVGDEFQVSHHESSHEYNSDIIALDDGSFLTTWYVSNTEGSGNEVYIQRYHQDGSPIGEAFRVNDYQGAGQEALNFDVLSDGRLVAVWQSGGAQDGNGYGAFGKVIALDGPVSERAKAGTSVGRVEVTDPDLGDQHQFVLEDNAGGRFAIDEDSGVISVANPALIDYEENISHELSVKVTDSAGLTLTQTITIDVAPGNRASATISLGMVDSGEFAVNQHTSGNQDDPQLTALDNGGFMAVWVNQNASTSAGGDNSNYSVKARLFDADGQPQGNEILINQTTYHHQHLPSATTLTNGEVLVTWSSLHNGSTYRVYGRRFDEDGNALTGEITLFESAGGSQYHPEVSALADGGYVVSWYDSSQDGNGNGVYAQRFNADGEGQGQFKVNSWLFLKLSGWFSII